MPASGCSAKKASRWTSRSHDHARPARPWLFLPRRLPRSRCGTPPPPHPSAAVDRKSTRLNSSHPSISYAVFCLKKKKKTKNTKTHQTNKTDYKIQITLHHLNSRE